MFFKSKCAFTPRLYLGCLKGLYGVGIPGSVAAISYTFSQTVTVGFIGSIGTAALNAYSYINSISSYTYFVSSALGAAVSIFAGRYFGKCDATSIKKMLRLSIFFAVCINVLSSAVAFIFHKGFLSAFTDNGEIIAMSGVIFAVDIVVEGARGIVHLMDNTLKKSI